MASWIFQVIVAWRSSETEVDVKFSRNIGRMQGKLCAKRAAPHQVHCSLPLSLLPTTACVSHTGRGRAGTPSRLVTHVDACRRLPQPKVQAEILASFYPFLPRLRTTAHHGASLRRRQREHAPLVLGLRQREHIVGRAGKLRSRSKDW